MNENYLWDRSGEPDPEVQNLEQILGSLRYQPRPLEIPNDVRLKVNRPLFTKLAIAAAIGLIAVALGLWVNFNRPRTVPAVVAKHDAQTDQKIDAPQPQIAPNDRTRQLAVGKE